MTRWFGTNGIREVVGQTLTAPFVTRVAAAIASTLPPPATIAVGRDGRTSSPAFSRIVGSTLALAGHRVVDLGLLPTPAIQYSVPRVGAKLAVIVTASHNPPEFNGIKCIGEDGLEATRETEEAIEAAIDRGVTPTVPFNQVGSVLEDHAGAERYLAGIEGQIDVKRIRSRHFTVALDCGNGASIPTSPVLLNRLGCRVVSLNAQIDGTFPGRQSEPTEAALADLCRVVPTVGATFGAAHDGDADRAAFVDASGHFVPGERMLTLLAREAVARHHGGTVVVPVTASQAVEDAVKPLGGTVVYTRVGSPSVTRAMLERRAVFGGEDNGGLVFPSFQLARDGAMSVAATLDLLAWSERPLADLLSEVPHYALVREKVACPVEYRDRVIGRVTESMRTTAERTETLDGVKAYLEGGWVLLRPSGTEPIFRISAEAKDPSRARALADLGLEQVRRVLTELGVPAPART
jgi:phosphomannomutase / phosphoglucomutase